MAMASTSLSSPRPSFNGNIGFSGANMASIRVARVLAPLAMALASIPMSYAAPLLQLTKEHGGDDDLEPKPADDPSLWIYLGTAVALVLIGGVFAGLTIAYVYTFFLLTAVRALSTPCGL